MRLTLQIFIGFCALLFPFASHALTQQLPTHLAPLVLSETVPFSFSSPPYREDFTLEWAGESPEGIRIRFGEKSFEWVRVEKVFTLPRAHVVVEAPAGTRGSVLISGFQQTLDPQGRADVPFALLSGPTNPIELRVERGGNLKTYRAFVKYTPKSPEPLGIRNDTTCSLVNMDVELTSGPQDTWAAVSCRFVYSQGDQFLTPSLEIFVLWDGVGETLVVDGLNTPSTIPSLWTFRAKTHPGEMELRAGDRVLRLRWKMPERLRRGFLGLGVGPYTYTYEGAGHDVHTVVPLATFYGSYFLTESLRVVSFAAVPVHHVVYLDWGVYFLIEQFRGWDERVTLNLLLGGHFLGFKARDKFPMQFSGPQGVEFIFRDLGIPRYNLGLGVFANPGIGDRSYYNFWVRYGTASVFAEINYIAWKLQYEDERYFHRSLGLSVGFPIARFF
jgi:hypothetical protein